MRREDRRLAAVHLAVASRKNHGFGKSRDTEMPASAMPFFAAEQVLRHQRPVGPGQHVVVHRVDLAERAAHLADLGQQAAGQRGEGDEAFLDLHAFGPERQEEVGARVRIDDGLERGSASCISSDGRASTRCAHRAQEVADDGDVGIEHLRARRGVAVDGQWAGCFGAHRARRSFDNGWWCRRSGPGLSRRGSSGRPSLERLELRREFSHLFLQRRELRPEQCNVVGRRGRLGASHPGHAGQEN